MYVCMYECVVVYEGGELTLLSIPEVRITCVCVCVCVCVYESCVCLCCVCVCVCTRVPEELVMYFCM